MTLYVLNTLIVPVDFSLSSSALVRFRRIDVEEARSLLVSEGFESAVGHEGTARLLSSLLGLEVGVNRRTIFMEKGDRAIHFFLRQRLPEGAILSEEELRRLDFWLIFSEVVESE